MEQPADLVIIGAFQFHIVYLMLLSGIGEPYNPGRPAGVVGRNFAYQNMTTIKAIFDKDTYTNPFIGAAATASVSTTSTPTTSTTRGGLWSAVRRSGSTRPGPAHLRFPGTAGHRRGAAAETAVADTYTHHLSMDAHGAHQSYRS